MLYRANERIAYRKDVRPVLIRQAKYRAKQRGTLFKITAADVAPCPEFCPLLGIPIFVADGCGALGPNSPTLDRINNDRGYVPGNVMIVSHLANSSKRELNSTQLMCLATNLKRFEKELLPWEL